MCQFSTQILKEKKKKQNRPGFGDGVVNILALQVTSDQ